MNSKTFNLMDLIYVIEDLIVLEYEIDYPNIGDNIDTIINISNNYFDMKTLYLDCEYEMDFIKEFESIKIRISVNYNHNITPKITINDIQEYKWQIWVDYSVAIKRVNESFRNHPKLKNFLNFLIHEVYKNNYTDEIPIYEIFEKYSYRKRGIPDLLETKNNAYVFKMNRLKQYRLLDDKKFN